MAEKKQHGSTFKTLQRKFSRQSSIIASIFKKSSKSDLYTVQNDQESKEISKSATKATKIERLDSLSMLEEIGTEFERSPQQFHQRANNYADPNMIMKILRSAFGN